MSKQPSGVLIGQKGVQYGLQKVAPKKAGLPGAPAVPRKVAPANVFGDDDSEEEDVERQIARQADKKRAAAKVQQMYEDALATDPSAFEYDGVYESIQEARVAPKQQDKVQRHSKYIASLLEQAQQRKREQDVLYERRMVRERQQEDHLYEDKERFVTGAYRRKLEEDKKWQEAERQRELEEQRNDVRKVGHMGNFYANLLTKNVAFGTAKHDEPGSRLDAGMPEPEDGLDGRPGASASPSPGLEGSPPPRGGGSGIAFKGPAAASDGQGPSAKVLGQLDRYDVLRLEAERALREKKRGEQYQDEEQVAGGGRKLPEQQQVGKQEAAGPASQMSAGVRLADSDPLQQEARQQGDPQGSRSQAGEARGVPGSDAAAGGVPVAVASAVGKRRNDDTSVQSARERYLARKQQKVG